MLRTSVYGYGYGYGGGYGWAYFPPNGRGNTPGCDNFAFQRATDFAGPVTVAEGPRLISAAGLETVETGIVNLAVVAEKL